MKSEFYRRRMAAFFSYSSKDDELAQSLIDWLEGFADLRVWHDRKDLAAGQTPASALERSVRECRAYILLLTPHSLNSRWAALEHDVARQQAAEHAGFKRIVLVTPEVDAQTIPETLESVTRIQLPARELDGASAAKLLASLRADTGPAYSEDDIFITRTWRQTEPASPFADQACSWLVEKAGYRLVGDEPRNDDDPDRLRNIIASCAAYVALVPPRDAADLEFLLRDLQIAQDCGLPVIVVADPKVVEMERQQLLHTPDKACVRFAGALRVLPADMSGGSMDRSLRESLDLVLQMVGGAGARRRNSYSVFYACNPERLSEHERSDIDRVVRGVTGRRCVFADGIDGENADERTLQEIGAAVATIADVSANSLDGWVCAGIARAARRPVALLATEAGLPRPALFSRYKLRRYHSHAERVGLVHAAVYEHRRLFLNQEVLRWT